MNTHPHRFLPFLLLAGLLAGCGTLASGGAYQGDATLYAADSTAATVYAAIDDAMTWEHANYQTLSPAAQAAFNAVRAQAPKAYASYLTLRAAYLANKSAANQTAMQSAVTDLSGLLNSIVPWLPTKATTVTPTNPAPAAAATGS